MRTVMTEDGLAIDLEGEADTDRLAAVLASLATPGTVIGLVGPLGAGKTRFARGFAEALGVDGREVTSPTYVLIHEYEGTYPIYHFDAYRLGGPGPFEALGAAEYWDAGGACLVEWADLVADLLPVDAWWLRFEHAGDNDRRATFRGAIASKVAERLAEFAGRFDRGGEQV